MTGPARSLTETVTSLVFRPLLALADGTAAAAKTVRAAAGDLPEPATLETHVPAERWLATWEVLERARPDVAVSIEAAERTSLSDLEVFGFLAMTAGSLAEAFMRVGRVRTLWARGLGWTLDERDDVAHLRLSPWSLRTRGAELAHEHLLAEMVQSVREIVDARVAPEVVRIAHAAPEDEEPYRHFFACPVRFDSDVNAITFGQQVARLPVKAFDTRLHSYFERECEALVERAGKGGWLRDVRRWIAEAYAHGPPTAKACARSMAMSDRTLRRRLEEAGTSFKRIQEEVAVELANAYLRRPGLTASEVAFLVGFSEPSAFFRAYRRWTGETPKSFQARELR